MILVRNVLWKSYLWQRSKASKVNFTKTWTSIKRPYLWLYLDGLYYLIILVKIKYLWKKNLIKDDLLKCFIQSILRTSSYKECCLELRICAGLKCFERQFPLWNFDIAALCYKTAEKREVHIKHVLALTYLSVF